MSYTPALSSAGVGSGLDVNSLVSNMMSLEKRPLQLLQTKISSTETKISSYGQVKSAISGLYDAAKALTDLTTWRGKLVTSGDKSIVTGTATDSATAANFSLQVNQLAQGQSLASDSFASGSALGTDGQLTIQVGRWDSSGTSFTAGSNTPLQINISATDTLADVAAKITNSGSSISAVVVKGSNGDRLLVRNSETGEENGFSISVQGGGNLDKLAYDEASVASAQPGMTNTVKARDAEFTINGMEVTSASNTVKEVVPGLTLNLLKTTTSAVDISIGANKDDIKAKVKAFTEAFNKANSLMRSLSAYNDQTKTSQPLQGDSAIRSLQSALNNLMQKPNADGTSFASLGLEIKLDSAYRNPTLSLDESKLEAALNDMPALERALSGDSVNDGLISRIRDFAFEANGVNGNITTRTKGLESLKKSDQDAVSAMELRLEQRQSNLLKQYQALDTKISSMSSLSSLVSQLSG